MELNIYTCTCSTVLGRLYSWSDTKKTIILINLNDRLTHIITAEITTTDSVTMTPCYYDFIVNCLKLKEL